LQDGSIQVWDFLDRSNEPFMVVPASAAAVTCLEFWNQASPQLLGVGDAQGILHIMEIPRSLRRPLHKEVSTGGLGLVWSLVGGWLGFDLEFVRVCSGFVGVCWGSLGLVGGLFGVCWGFWDVVFGDLGRIERTV
jgi:hypothetical protein